MVQWEADKTHSLDELEAQHQYANDLEKQIEALAQKLQSANARYKQKVNIILASLSHCKETIILHEVSKYYNTMMKLCNFAVPILIGFG